MATDIQTVTADETGWSLAQRKAKALVSASLVPEAYRNNIPNALIAMEIADRLGASPLMVMQNLHIISGRPSWSASFLIATVNQCGRFSPLRFDATGDDPRTEGYRVRAYADDKATGDRCEGEWIDWAMVRGEGWNKKAGSKWLTMPGQMFRYRAASFWTRVFAPEVSMGIYTADEVEDMGVGNAPHLGTASVDLSARIAQAEVVDAGTQDAPSAPEAPKPATDATATENASQTGSGDADRPFHEGQ